MAKRRRGEAPERLAGPGQKGPKGGTTTVTPSGMVKKNLWITRAMAEWLRQEAFAKRTSEAEIIRKALIRHFRQSRFRQDAEQVTKPSR